MRAVVREKIADTPAGWIGLIGISLYLFVAFSRLSESIAAVFGVVLRFPMVFLAFASIGAAMQPTMLGSLRNRVTLLYALLSLWFLACVPFSVHKGGSVRMLAGYWLTSMIACGCVMSIGQTLGATRQMLYSVVSGAILVLLLSVSTSSNPELQNVIGGLTNPNLYGQHLLYTLPFLCIPIFRRGLFSIQGLLAGSGAALILVKVIFTGSRASLVAIVVMAAMLFLRVSFLNKLILVAAGIPALLILYAAMPQMAKDRYSTIIRNENEYIESIDALGAIESANSRKQHLQQSIDLTFRNPIFGVGPGMFPVASADYSQELGEKALWKETHNTYSQISSESGFPGLILYLTFLGITLWSQLKTLSASRRAPADSKLAECGYIAYALFLSMVGTLVTGTFSSIGYQIYFPLLGAFSMVIWRLTQKELCAASQAT